MCKVSTQQYNNNNIIELVDHCNNHHINNRVTTMDYTAAAINICILYNGAIAEYQPQISCWTVPNVKVGPPARVQAEPRQ